MSSTILVVEDEPAIQELIAVNLSFAGHKVLRAFDVAQAETLIRAELPDLILLDWMLPGASGLTLARKLRSDDRTRLVPVIMLTAKGAEQDKVDGLEAGAEGWPSQAEGHAHGDAEQDLDIEVLQETHSGVRQG